jgi:23S rRNA (adenine2503-C2)-methyltransferase
VHFVSQVGCTLTCSFCHTGTQKLVRNLTAGEIVGQVMLARDDLGEWPEPGATPRTRPRLLSNIVLMGMGEPLYNFENVRDAMKIAMDPRRYLAKPPPHHVVDQRRGARDRAHGRRNRLPAGGVSFHATTDDVRDKLVPINKKWNDRNAAGGAAGLSQGVEFRAHHL